MKKSSLFKLAEDCGKYRHNKINKKVAIDAEQVVSKKQEQVRNSNISNVQSQHYDHGHPLSLSYQEDDLSYPYSMEETTDFSPYEEVEHVAFSVDENTYVEPFEDQIPQEETDRKANQPTQSDMPLGNEDTPANPTSSTEVKDNKQQVPKLLEDNDKEQFEADIKAILAGKKRYDAEQKEVVPSTRSKSNQQPSPVKEPESQMPDFKKNEHDIFNKIAQNLAYSNTYDLGDISLESRLNAFDKEMDSVDKKKVST